MVVVNLKAIAIGITDSKLERLSADNPDARLETNAEGHLIVMSPTGSENGRKNFSLIGQVYTWNQRNKLGVAFDSSTGFKLSNGAIRSPDVTWIELSRWNELTPKQQRGYAPIDPDFVIELMSPTDDLSELQQKMLEYMYCGVKLGWLINPDERQVEIYHQNRDKEILDNPRSLNGEDILVDLTVDLTEII